MTSEREGNLNWIQLVEVDVLKVADSSRHQGYLGLFPAQTQKVKKNCSKKISYLFSKKVFIFWEMELFSSRIKKVLLLSRKKAFLIFREMELLKKPSYISGGNFPSFEKISVICFLKQNFFLYFRKELEKPKKQKFLAFQDD